VYFAPKPDVPASYFRMSSRSGQDIDAVVGLQRRIPVDQAVRSGPRRRRSSCRRRCRKRIELSSRRFEIEVVRHAARCFLHMNQRMILGTAIRSGSRPDG
jgi:hypothetical protein